MNISDALLELGKQLNLPDLVLDDDGYARVLFDDSLVTGLQSIDADENDVGDGMFESTIAIVPPVAIASKK